MSKSVELDKINRRILVELQRDDRITNLDLSDRVGLSASACLKRVQALEAAGCIHGYVMSANLDRIAHHSQAYLLVDMVDTMASTLARFEQYVRATPIIIDCMRVGGTPDYIALIVASDMTEISQLIDEMAQDHLSVARVNLRMVLGRSKWFEGYPLEALKWKERT